GWRSRPWRGAAARKPTARGGADSDLSLGAVAVAEAVDGLDAVEFRRHFGELAPQPFDMAVDRAFGEIGLVRIALFDQLVPRLDVTGMASERQEETELP